MTKFVRDTPSESIENLKQDQACVAPAIENLMTTCSGVSIMSNCRKSGINLVKN